MRSGVCQSLGTGHYSSLGGKEQGPPQLFSSSPSVKKAEFYAAPLKGNNKQTFTKKAVPPVPQQIICQKAMALPCPAPPEGPLSRARGTQRTFTKSPQLPVPSLKSPDPYKPAPGACDCSMPKSFMTSLQLFQDLEQESPRVS